MNTQNEEVGTRRGKIYCVKVVNFVTYDEVCLFPTEYLNIIIGPNGTGKSTLVSAIVLGLGGSPKLISRSHDLLEFIKTGQEKAEIEIHLYKNDEETVTVTRTFEKNGTDTFKVDGKHMSLRAVLQYFRNEFNVQIDNLCQFLPQDRVQDFAKMNAHAILAKTQESCAPELKKKFDKLIELRENQKNIGTTTEKMKRERDDLVSQNEALRPQIESMQERRKLIEDIEMCDRKRLWLEVEPLLEKVKESQKDLVTAKTRLLSCEEKLKPRLAEAEQIKAIKQGLDERTRSDRQDSSKAVAEIEKFEDNLTKLERELQRVAVNQREVVSDARAQKQELENAKLALHAMSQDLVNVRQKYGDQSAFKNEIDTLKNSSAQRNQKKSQLAHVLEQKQDEFHRVVTYPMTAARTRLTKLEDVENRRLEKFASNFESAYKANMWLDDNRHRFKGRVFRPIMLEIKVFEQKNAKFFENLIMNRDLIAFTFEDKNDVKLFIHEVREKMRLQVNTLQSDPADRVLYQPSIPITHLRRYGFQTYLVDLISGPPPILNYLCRSYHIHNIPVGTDKTFECAGSVPPEIRTFFTPNNRFTTSVSRYSGQKSTSMIEIRPRNILDTGVDQGAVQECQKTLGYLQRESDTRRSEMMKLENGIRAIDEELATINAQRRKIEENFNAVTTAFVKLQRQEVKVNHLKNSMIDVPKQKEKFKQQAIQIMRNRFEIHKKIATILEKHGQLCASLELNKERMRVFQVQNGNMGAEIDALEEQVRKAKTCVNQIESHANHHQAKYQEKLSKAKRSCNGQEISAKTFKYKAQFKLLPNALDGLVEKMYEMNARMQCLNEETAGIQEEYDNRNVEIQNLTTKITEVENSTGKIQTQIEELHAAWYTELEQMVMQINETFQGFMNAMQFSGEIRLDRRDDYNYSDYSIGILVKYRNEEKLQALDRFVQSGGERAVATAIYTLSLQKLSKVPFRCVDEINQGMDPRNERRVFSMLVKETCQIGQSQYFFITPKLLPNLPYNDLMTVQIVHNGPNVSSPYVFCHNELEFEEEDE